MNMLDRAKRRYSETGFLSLFRSGYRLSYDKIMYSLVYADPSLCQYLEPKLGLVCIEPTNCCNLKCKMCIRDRMDRQQGFMDLDLFKKVVDELDVTTTLAMYFCGEPLLHPEFIDMLEYARSRNFVEINFTTNGMLFTDKTIDVVVKNNIDVFFSVEGLGIVNDNIRVGDDFETVVRNIRALACRKRELNGKGKICISLTKSSQTSAEVNETIGFFKDVADKITVIPCRSLTNLVDNDFFDAETTPMKFCKMPFRFLGVLWNGDVTACCYDFLNKLKVGNINEQTLKQIWMDKPIIDIRHACLTNTFPTGCLCGACDAEKQAFVNKTVQRKDMSITYQRNVKVYEKAQ